MRWENFEEILTEQLDLLNSLLMLYEKERIALCRLDAAMLEEAVEKKNGVLERFNELEQSRVEAIRKAGLEGKSLKEIAALAPSEFANRLLDLRKDLKEKAEKLNEMQQMNRSLIVNAQLQTEVLTRILGAAAGKTYSSEGKIESARAFTLNRRG